MIPRRTLDLRLETLRELAKEISLGNAAAPCYCGMQLQIARRRAMVGSRWPWVADGGAVLLENANIADR